MMDSGMFGEAAKNLGKFLGMKDEPVPEPPLVPVVNDAAVAQATQAALPNPGMPPQSIAVPQSTAVPMQQPQSAPQTPTPMQIAQQQTSYEAGKKPSPELIASGNAVTEKQKEAADAQANALSAAARLESAEYQNRANQLEKQNQADAVEQQKIGAELDKRIASWQTAVDEYKTFSQARQDGKRDYYEVKGVGRKIADSIAMALGAFGAALARTPNYAADQINKDIDRHIQKEEAEERRLGRSVDLQQNGIAFFRQKGLDAQAARLARRQSLLDQSKAQVEAITARSKSPEILANAQATMAAIDALAQANAEKHFLDAQGKSVSVTQKVPAGSGGVAIDDLKKLHEMSNSDPTLKNYRQARTAADNFRALVDAKAEGAAVVDFIATGMHQNSFPPEFLDLLKKRGFIDKAGELVRSKFKGGYDPALLKEMQAGLDAVQAVTFKRSEKTISDLQRMGLPASLIVGGDSENDIARKLGGVAK